MPRRPLYVIGTAGLAREMAQLAMQVHRAEEIWDFRGFIGERDDLVGSDLGIGPVAGTDASLLEGVEHADIVIGIGRPDIRARVATAYRSKGETFAFPNLIHPTASMDRRFVDLGVGNAITAGCILTMDIQIGDFNLFNWQTTVGHDARVGAANVLNPNVNVSGGVSIEDRVLIGTGVQILENRHIGSDAIVGAGAVVNRDVDDATTVVGVPARPLRAPS